MALPNPPTPYPPTPAPNLTADQTAAVIALSNALQSALWYSVKDSSGNLLVPAAQQAYRTKFTLAQQQATLDYSRGLAAALMQVLGLPAASGLSTSIDYLKPDSSTGTLTFTNGILTGAI